VIFQAIESSTTWLEGFDTAWLPPQLYKDVRLVQAQGKVGLEIGNVVGVAPLSNGDTLQIIPKVGNLNFIRMLLICEGLYAELERTFQELATYASAEDQTAIWFLARSLADALLEIHRKSLRFDHKFFVKRGTYASGHIFALETTRRLLQRTPDAIVMGTHERDYDTVENRVLGKAAQVALPLISGTSDSQRRKILESWAYQFGQAFTVADLLEVDKTLLGRKQAGSRGYYARALGIAKILLGQAGISTGFLHLVEAEGVLVNSATLFENFIRKVLIEKHKASGILVTKGGGLSVQTLYTDGYFELEPDYVLQGHSQIRLIADAKYKVPDSKDHFQMICYLSRYGVRSGVLLMPCFSERPRNPIQHLTPEGTAVWEVELPLSDMGATESILADLLNRFATH
jgi:5-methylcytosine-specific restriction endonuclease McrBC regulatory subunit McrC